MEKDTIITRDYQSDDLKALIPILLSTWTYEKKGTIKEREKATELFLLRCLLECDERKVLLVNNEVKGLMFARIKRGNEKDREEYIHKSIVYRKSRNIDALCLYNDIIFSTNEELLQIHPQKGIELNLLIIDPSCRGKHCGQFLVNSLIDSHPHQEIYLFSDLDCSYSFYFSLGFSIVAEKENTYSFFSENKIFHSFLLSERNENQRFFLYNN